MIQRLHDDERGFSLIEMLVSLAVGSILLMAIFGITTHKNKYDFVTLDSFETMYSTDLQKPPGAKFWDWINTAQFKV